MTNLVEIRKLSFDELKNWFQEQGEQTFRAKQVYEWLWQKNALSFDAMSNLSKDLRKKLGEHFVVNPVSVAQKNKSSDGSVKFGFELHDGRFVEGVLIPTSSRVTACVSSQVGCSLTCKFCATGYMKMERNLEAYEIFDQVNHIRREALDTLGQPLTNIVYMGMGEPLLNYKNVLASIEKISSPEGMAFSPRRITVSTAGVAKMIKRLGDDDVRFEFALSLHAANDEKRNEIMPINETNSLEALKEALQYFYEKTQTRVTFEYIVFKDFNDSLKDAEELYQFSRCIPCKINIIEYNPIAESDFKNTSVEKLDSFTKYLEKKGLIVNVRRSRGKDVDGACGQLAIKNKA